MRQRLTEVKRHADEDDEAEPGVEVGDEVDDGDDDVRNGGEDAEHNIAAEGIIKLNTQNALSPVGEF